MEAYGNVLKIWFILKEKYLVCNKLGICCVVWRISKKKRKWLWGHILQQLLTTSKNLCETKKIFPYISVPVFSFIELHIAIVKHMMYIHGDNDFICEGSERTSFRLFEP